MHRQFLLMPYYNAGVLLSSPRHSNIITNGQVIVYVAHVRMYAIISYTEILWNLTVHN